MSVESTPAALLAEMAALRKQNARMAKRLDRTGADRQSQRVERMVDRSLLDALAIVTVHVGGGVVYRDVAPLPQRRWAHAVALLRLAGLAEGRTVRLTLAETPQATIDRLQQAAALAKVHPARWAAFMPTYNRPEALTQPAHSA